MLKRFSEIQGMILRAVDHEVGSVIDLLFEDHGWNVRYLVVDIRHAIVPRRVLISPAAIEGFNFQLGLIATSLNSQQVIDSPPVDFDQPISRKHEEKLVNYFGWPIYWLGRLFQSPQSLRNKVDDPQIDESADVDANLRSANEVCGYRIVAGSNADSGSVTDLIINMNSMRVEFAAGDLDSLTHQAGPAFPTDAIDQIDWKGRQITVRPSILQTKTPNQKRVMNFAHDNPIVLSEPRSINAGLSYNLNNE